MIDINKINLDEDIPQDQCIVMSFLLSTLWSYLSHSFLPSEPVHSDFSFIGEDHT